MLSQQIRQKFLAYFKKMGHTHVPSSSVIPHNDPTLLFINAGMNQFKDVFLGESIRDYTKATTSQKCIRVGGKHNDLDNVGHTTRHTTFFEMLGNFSFGDYFKKEAIASAWEVTTKIFEFDPEFLWASVFHEDDESFELWRAYLPENRIVRMGEKDNFWAMGDVGPCGPCSELYYDKGKQFGKAPSPAQDVEGERFLEFWNLVFMQYNRDSSGEMILLPKQSVDTGAGLERIISLIMGVESVFETDILRSLIGQIETISKVPYQKEPAFHVIADHIRTLAFAIADGVEPSNLDRGYVLRKVLRRAVRYGRQLELNRPFLAELLPTLISHMGEDFPELKKSESIIAELLTREEEAFLRTLKRGGNLLNQIITSAKDEKIISGDNAFKLKDTYGLPLEEILLLAKDANLGVDIKRYETLEHEAKERSRGAREVTAKTAKTSLFENYAKNNEGCSFVGYDLLTTEAIVLGLVKDGAFVDVLHQNEEGLVLLDQTPFYAEKGGQVADQGAISSKDVLFEVLDCQNPYGEVVVHSGVLKEGQLRVGTCVCATVDSKRRQHIANNHTATHLLHWALSQVLGGHIKQAGSIVEPNRLRFDFHHPKPLSKTEVREVEKLINEKIRDNQKVNSYELSYQEAQKRDDIQQIFGEKYGTSVRVIDIDYSKELCGGTHTHSVGTIGYFRILKEGSIASGVRRIEAVSGVDAEEFVAEEEMMIEHICETLKVRPSHLMDRISKMMQEHNSFQKHLEKERYASLHSLGEKLANSIETDLGIPLLATQTDLPPAQLKELSDCIFKKAPSLVLLLLNDYDGKVTFLARVSDDLIKQKIFAGDLIKTIAPTLGGKGGGKPDLAQGGGTKADQIPEAIKITHQWILSKLS